MFALIAAGRTKGDSFFGSPAANAAGPAVKTETVTNASGSVRESFMSSSESGRQLFARPCCSEVRSRRLLCPCGRVSGRPISLHLALFSPPVNVGRVVQFRVLGLLEVSDGGRPLSLPR